MAENPFDKASRSIATLDPRAFLSWALRLPPSAFTFRGWIDARGIAFPGEPDRAGDTVAHIENATEHGVPWAIAVEFQIRPDADMFGRLLSYLAGIWLNRRPDDVRGSRFNLGAVVVNLTGFGTTSQMMSWAEPALQMELRAVDRNLAYESATELLTRLEAGEWSRCLLPWVPLMSGAENPETIDRWVALGSSEPDRQRRAQFGAIALLFARRVSRGKIWEDKLMGWNVEESTYVNEWIAVGEKRGEARGKEIGSMEAAQTSILRLGTKKFGPVSHETEAALRAIQDRARLERILDRILDATSWADLIATA
jgi:hypothetical protein